ncbi:MAG: T9SS type A sorting domain-containing protein [Bacteroidetes bacterium]|nr:T9SS type A sorting domain-containing protein [Bacteroidota bacterium]
MVEKKIPFILAFLLLACTAVFPQGNMNWDWVKTAGGLQSQKATSIAVNNNDVVIAGTFNSNYISLESNIVVLTNSDSNSFTSNYFVAKYNQNGQVIWAKKAFSNVGTSSNKIVIDNNGNIYACGFINTTNGINTISFDGASSYTHTGGKSFLTKYSPQGSTQWVLFINNKFWGYDTISSLKWDRNTNSLLIAGHCLGDTVGIGNMNIINSGNNLHSSFVAKIDVQQGNVVWISKTKGNSFINKINEIALDTSGSIYTAASFLGSYLVLSPIDSLVNSTSSAGALFYDGYFAKYNKNGVLQWCKKGICNSDDEITAITCRNNNHLVIGGYNNSTLLLNNGASLNGKNFILEYDLQGNFVNAANFTSTITSISAYKSGSGFVIGGIFTSDSLIFGNTILHKHSTPSLLNTNIFICRSDSFATYNNAIAAGGFASCNLNSVIVADSNKLYACGSFNQPSINFGAMQFNSHGITDLFLTKLDAGISPPIPLKYNMGGTVFVGSMPVDHAMAYLYEMNHSIIDSCKIDTMGFYQFYQKPMGNYKISAEVLSNSIYFNQNYSATFYPNKTSFADAETILLNTNRWERNIQLQNTNTVDESNTNLQNLVILKTYPNPAKNDLDIIVGNKFLGDCKMIVMNTNGQLVLTKICNNESNTEMIHLNISSLKQGLYHLILIDKLGNYGSSRFVKTE